MDAYAEPANLFQENGSNGGTSPESRNKPELVKWQHH
jgi:hypothetical protein